MSIDSSTQGSLASGNQAFRAQLAGLIRSWPLILLCMFLGVGIAVVVNQTTQPRYQANLTFFVATSGANTTTALQADEFAQRRINSYVGVIHSETFARTILADTRLSLAPDDVTAMLNATVDPDTVLMNVSVTDTDPARTMQVARSVAANLDRVISDVDNRSNRSQVELRVISGPSLYPAPVSPRINLNLALGLAIGAAVGVVLALAIQQFDTSFRGRDALARVTGVPTLGTLVKDRHARKMPILVGGDNRTRRAEGYRQLRTALRFVNAAKPIQVLVVTSSVEAEGKTTAAVNLAQTFAKASVRTLLVDADLRRPKLEELLDIEAAAGLTTALLGDATWSDLTQEWGPDGLTILASGPIPPNPSELLSSEAMADFLEQARSEFSLIIIDSPPILPVTDSVVTSVLADGVLLAVRYGRTKRDQVEASMEALNAVGVRVVGTALTMVPSGPGGPKSSYYQERTGAEGA